MAEGVEHFSRRDAHQAFRALFKTVDQLDPILTLLDQAELIKSQGEPRGQFQRAPKLVHGPLQFALAKQNQSKMIVRLRAVLFQSKRPPD